MKRFLIFSGVAILIIVILGGIVLFFMKKQTKSFSPEEHITFSQNDLTITVLYNRPFKKGRQIFGGLVPYGKVWRTGANEATTLETNKPLTIEGKLLKPGKYSLWTIPHEDTWTVIFNSTYGQWGINFDGESNRDAAKDVLLTEVKSSIQTKTYEQFTISFENHTDTTMNLMWDKTVVTVPFAY